MLLLLCSKACFILVICFAIAIKMYLSYSGHHSGCPLCLSLTQRAAQSVTSTSSFAPVITAMATGGLCHLNVNSLSVVVLHLLKWRMQSFLFGGQSLPHTWRILAKEKWAWKLLWILPSQGQSEFAINNELLYKESGWIMVEVVTARSGQLSVLHWFFSWRLHCRSNANNTPTLLWLLSTLMNANTIYHNTTWSCTSNIWHSHQLKDLLRCSIKHFLHNLACIFLYPSQSHSFSLTLPSANLNTIKHVFEEKFCQITSDSFHREERLVKFHSPRLQWWPLQHAIQALTRSI